MLNMRYVFFAALMAAAISFSRVVTGAIHTPLVTDDECDAGTGTGTNGPCALSALQRRAKTQAVIPAARTEAQVPNGCHGHSDALALPKIWAPEIGDAPPMTVRVLSYNLFWWSLFKLRKGNHNSTGLLIKKSQAVGVPFDFMGFQECEDPDQVLAPVGLLENFTAIMGQHAICMAYRKTAWALLASGQEDVAEDMPTRWYGKRGTQWMRLRHLGSNRTALFLNHHGPLSVNSGGVCGGLETAQNLLRLMGSVGHPGDLIILVGDFNANAASLTIQGLWPHLSHVYNGDCFGGVDNVFSNAVLADVLATENLGPGGSDHDAISATLVAPTGARLEKQMASTANEPSKAIHDLTGKFTSGDNWETYWCGRMEEDVAYTMEAEAGNSWSLDKAEPNPDWCCRECQREPKCQAFIWNPAGPNGVSCLLRGGRVSSRSPSPGVVSGMPVAAAASAAASAAATLGFR